MAAGVPRQKRRYKAVMAKDGGDFSKVKVINIGTADFFTAIERDIDFAWIYYAGTRIEAEQRGLELNIPGATPAAGPGLLHPGNHHQ